jgi:hypothetical protein
MKVLDLQCCNQHTFEGWFASEEDFVQQLEDRLVECPVCGDATVNRRPSAPRLNLVGARVTAAATQDATAGTALDNMLQSAWLAIAHRIVANTDDVGEHFAEEARKIHYGETKERAIRGQASRADTQALIEEGVAVIPFHLPEALKKPLH